MRSFGAAALFIIAVVTECLGAQERSRQRSGPIRSVPVAADIKRVIDFDCPEEFGYYPHPTDCSLYYVCVFGGALLESCTGGLMYSHELQTCDWPRNVGCDGTSGSAINEDLERLSEREPSPPPPPPRRTPSAPPPLPRVQPNPVVTSRGQPKFNREDYEKQQQQQLYEEVDDLPPVEEIESDRQQRVYRGQPSTIGQVQKDRDGYGSQVVSSRTLNSNIIPASISQTVGKIGSFSFGTQVDERRTPTATPAPQSYSDVKIDNVTDSSHDRHADIQTNESVVSNAKSLTRRKRETTEIINPKDGNNITSKDDVSDRSDIDEVMEYFESDEIGDDGRGENVDDMSDLEDSERGKRQIRYILKNNYKNPGKVWSSSKPIKFFDYQPYTYNSNSQSSRYQSASTGANKNNYYDVTRRPYDNNVYSSVNPFLSYQKDHFQTQKPFVPSFPDLFDQRSPQHTPVNVATQIITKSPPISALKNNENPFSALAGGFFNNIAAQSNSQQNQNSNQFKYQTSSAFEHNQPFQDLSLLPTTVVTDKPIKMITPQQKKPTYSIYPKQNVNNNHQAQEGYENSSPNHQPYQNKIIKRPSNNEEVYDEDNDKNENDEEDDDENSEEEDEDNFYKNSFPKPPYEFTHPNHKYANIENPFADPNFDFDAFLSKLRNDHDKTIESTTSKPKEVQHHNIAVKIINPSTESNDNSGLRSSTLNYNVMSTPRPFTNPTGPNGVTIRIQDTLNTLPTTKQPEKFQNLLNLPDLNHQSFVQHLPNDENSHKKYLQQSAGIPIDAVRPKLKPPNFNDDRQLPISYSFSRPLSSMANPNHNKTKGETFFTATQKPYIFITSTGTPIILPSSKQKYYVNSEKLITLQPQMGTGKQYLTISSGKPYNGFITIQQSTPRPLTTIANEQLSALQQFWKDLSTESPLYIKSSEKPNAVSKMPNLESLFAQAIRSTLQTPINQLVTTTTTLKPSAKRRPIPKPSPEMNDYYYDDDEELYEPPVKSQYMPSTEIKPQRPLMAQNYKEYDDYVSEESPVNNKTLRTSNIRPANHRPDTVTKNHNDVSVVTKAPAKESNKYMNGKLRIPVMLSYITPAPNVLMRPEVTNYQIHHVHRNKTMFIRRPTYSGNGPYTMKPPKYLNQTTLRPYTVRHRLAKPTTVIMSSTDSGDKTTRGRVRHHNIVAQMKLTTPRDNHNQETRYTKTRHDDKTNSLEPTESVTPPSYSTNPRPKMLYNQTQSYAPDQYDPYYAVYDEDGELYKDTDYVQQYNTASLRPAVQQTYRGTPPPARRPVEVYTPRPTQEDYDDTLIHGQINNQNQYQSAIRHSTRGEGNELGFDHNPSSEKTTIYEAPTISTTPSTISTSTTTQRPTSAPITEAMSSSRFTQRSSTGDNPSDLPQSSSKSPSDGFAFSFPATLPTINFSFLAKPFEKTNNLNRLKETLPTTERFPNSRLPARVTNSNTPVKVARTTSDENNRKVVSLTTGFSIRRNSNNTHNPYTLTVLTRPFDSYNKSWKVDNSDFNSKKRIIPNINSNLDSQEGREQSVEFKDDDVVIRRDSSESSMRRSDSSLETVSEEEIKPFYLRPNKTKQNGKTRIISASTPATPITKYYLKTVIKRPAPFSANDKPHEDSTENAINTNDLIEAGLKNAREYEKSNIDYKDSANNELAQRVLSNKADQSYIRSSYGSLNSYNYYNNQQNNIADYTTSSTTTASGTITVSPRETVGSNTKTNKLSSKPSYFSYRVLDDEMPEHTTEIFSSSVKNMIKAFFNNFESSSKPSRIESSTLPFINKTEPEQKTVNIGFQKKPVTYAVENTSRTNEKRLQIISDPSINTYLPLGDQEIVDEYDSVFSSTLKTTTSTAEMPTINSSPQIFIRHHENEPKKVFTSPTRETFVSKFNGLVSKQEPEDSLKFLKLITETPSIVSIHNDHELDNEVTKSPKINLETSKTLIEPDWSSPISKTVNEIATTTSTTKSTVTAKIDSTSTTKSMSFPTRPSRVNPVIKLAATNPGGGRRSYQSPSKCSSDNGLHQNPKCNEIKYQRPSNTRGRGSAHYSTLSGDQPQQPNRGTPPTRSRPTLKPSTVIVTNSNPIVDIYTHPPRRPAPVYPQPTPDKTAAKCRKDVCLLPDCYCGGKDIPGDLPVESVPQIVLLTFDDSVNDLNKGLYADLFEKGRVNPNGCPISATFYVSHEWTDYSQVQNLYTAGHEMASHTISHSFGEQFSQKKWNREVAGQREILAAYGGVKLEDVRGMRAPFLSVGGNKMFKMLYDSNFTYDSSLPVYENRPPSWPYTLDYKLFHDCMIPPCPTKSYPGVWEVPMVMWQDLNGGRCSMGDACANPPEAEGVYKMLLKNFDRHYTTNRAPFGLYYHAAWFTQPHHKEGFIMFLDFINQMSDVWIVTNWQALQWVRDPTPISRLNNFQPFQCNYQDRPKKCNNPKVCNLWHKSGVRYMRTCQPCPEIYPWTGKTGIRSSRIDNDIEE